MPADLLLPSLLTSAERFLGPDRRDENKDAKSHLLNLVFVCVRDVWGRFASVSFRLCEHTHIYPRMHTNRPNHPLNELGRILVSKLREL